MNTLINIDDFRNRGRRPRSPRRRPIRRFNRPIYTNWNNWLPNYWNDWWWPRRLEAVKVIEPDNSDKDDLQTKEINENRTLLYVFMAVVLIVLFILAIRK